VLHGLPEEADHSDISPPGYSSRKMAF